MATILNNYSISGGDTTSSTFTSAGDCVTVEATTTNLSGVNSLIKIQSSDDQSTWKDIGQIYLGVGSDTYCNDPIKITGLYIRCLLVTNDSISGTITITATDGAGTALVPFRQEITELECATLNSVPVDISDLPAPGAGFAWEIVSASLSYTFVSVDYDFADLLVSTSTAALGQYNFAAPNVAADVFQRGRFTDGLGADTSVVNNTKMVFYSDIDPTVGDGTFIVYGTARKITI